MLRGSAKKDRVTVILREMRLGRRGAMEPVEVGRVDVWGRLQQSTTDDMVAFANAGESSVLNLKRFYCADFPGDNNSLVIDDRGAVFQVVGEPKRHRGSRRTVRDVVALRQNGIKRGEKSG